MGSGLGLLKVSDIRELIRLVDETSVTEVVVEAGDVKVAIRKAEARTAVMTDAVASQGRELPPSAPVVAAAPAAVAPATPAEEAPDAAAEVGMAYIRSPMVGTFYRASSPGAAAYVEPGMQVTERTVVCIVEAMKLMNEIEADVRGEIVDVLVENGHLVEYGQPLFSVRLA
jgi:acetyl-CoA carboxylase biotin carboxyl carrier protein